MSSAPACDEDLVRRLPLPLAQLYRRAHNAKTADGRLNAAYCLWEASLKLLASGAIVLYAERREEDPELTERLKSLARPALGHWWEFVRLLTPKLAGAGDEGFRSVRELLLGRPCNDLPRTAGLDAALRESLDGASGARSTVKLSELFDRLVRFRNREIGHGPLGQKSSGFYDKIGSALLLGVSELLGRLDVLAGRRLVYVSDVRKHSSGNWLVERYELTGESARRIEPILWPAAAVADLPDPERVYLDGTAVQQTADRSAGEHPQLTSLHPLVLCNIESSEVFFLNARRGQKRTEYLCYHPGRVEERDDLGNEQRDLLAKVLGVPVDGAQVDQWSSKLARDEAPAAEAVEAPKHRHIGEFELLSELGRGGMGVVYRAWQPSLGRQVALKCLLHVGNTKAEARFNREIRALGHVEHPHLVKAFTSGSDGKDWFYAMELVEGTTLSSVCDALQSRNKSAADVNLTTWKESLGSAYELSRKAEKPLSETQPDVPTATRARQEGLSVEKPSHAVGSQSYIRHMVDLVRQVAEAAHALHEAGVIHRDIKPGNVMVTADGSQAVLMDLGLAQLADDVDGRLTRTRQFVGTLRYASPEQILSSSQLDRRSDIYSLGATLWELLTLRPLYDATDATPTFELEKKILFQEPQAILKHNPAIGRDLEAIVAKCLEKEPGRRYATAADLAADLRRYLKGETPVARPIGKAARTVRWLKKRPALAGSLALACLGLAMALGGGLWYWDKFLRVKVYYYNDVVKRWGVFEGLGRVGSGQVRHRASTFKFYQRAGRTERVDVINSSGQLSADSRLGAFLSDDRKAETPWRHECRFEYQRDEKGQLAAEVAYNRFGDMLWSFVYTARDTGHYTDEHGLPRARSGSGAAYIAFKRSPEGFEEEMHYLDRTGAEPRPNNAGIYGERRKFDKRGQVVWLEFLDRDGKPKRIKDGYAIVSHQYDDQGNEIEKVYMDETGTPVTYRDGYAKVKWKYDQYSNPILFEYFDVYGRPTLQNEGYAKIRTKHDDRGYIKEIAYFDENDKPTYTEEGFSRWLATADDRGNRIENTYLDEFGKQIRKSDGFSHSKIKYDERDNRVEVAFFDEKGRPVRNRDGFARFTESYDKRGNKIGYATYDEQGRLIRGKDRYARYDAESDADGNRLGMRYFDENGKPTLYKDGYAAWANRFDSRGNIIEIDYFDEAHKPTRSKELIASSQSKFDDLGNEVEIAYFDPDGKATRRRAGYARMTRRYDERGHMVEEHYFDENGKPVLNKRDGFAWITLTNDDRGKPVAFAGFDLKNQPTRSRDDWTSRFAYVLNEHGKVIEVTTYDESGAPLITKRGYFKLTAKYDAYGHRIDEAYFDRDGKPTLSREQFARVQSHYDRQGNRIEEWFTDTEGKPTLSSEGYSHARMKFDNRGNKLESAFFDQEDRPTRLKKGYAKIAFQYDSRDFAIEEAYFDEAGKPIRLADGYAIVRKQYDDRGNVIDERYFDERGKPAKHREGYARLASRYDLRDNRIHMAYFDEHDKPVRSTNGHQQANISYDGRDRRIAVEYLDENDQLVPHIDGEAKFTEAYDEADNLIEVRYLDAKDQLVRIKDGYASWTAIYDARGNQIEKRYFDTAGKPTRNRDGAAKVATKYNENDLFAEQEFFDENGKLTRTADGHTRQVVRYDERGNMIEVTNFDVSGKPSNNVGGFARWTASYDSRSNRVEQFFYDASGGGARLSYGAFSGYRAKFDVRGNRLEIAYLDVKGKPGKHKDGSSILREKYDAHDNLIEQSFFDGDGKPVIIDSGFARWTAVYDDHGRQTERAYFGPDGQPIRVRSGFSKVVQTHDENGKLIKNLQIGFDGKHGYTRRVVLFDDLDRPISDAYFDDSGKPVRSDEGFAKLIVRLDREGNRLEESFYDEQDKLLLLPDGYAIERAKYDSAKHRLETVYLDEKERPIRNKKLGYARVTYEYNDLGLETERAFFDEKNQPARTPDGFSRVTKLYSNGKVKEETELGFDGSGGFEKRVYTYDSQGHPATTELYDAKGGRVLGSDGWFRRVTQWDSRGNITETAYFDRSNKPVRTKPGGFARVVRTPATGSQQATARYFDADGSELDSSSVVSVVGVIPGSSAESLRILPGDVLSFYDGQPVSSSTTFIETRSKEPATSGPKKLEIIRDGKPLQFSVKPGQLGLNLQDMVLTRPRPKSQTASRPEKAGSLSSTKDDR